MALTLARPQMGYSLKLSAVVFVVVVCLSFLSETLIPNLQFIEPDSNSLSDFPVLISSPALLTETNFPLFA